MKSIIKFLAVVSFSMLSAMAFSQKNATVAVLDHDEYETSIVEFTSQYAEGKTYLKWLVKGQKSDCAFLILRSFNKSDYEVIGSKNGYKVPHAIPLLYCYVDSVPLATTVYYKIKTLNFDDTKQQLPSNNESELHIVLSDKKKY